MPMSYRRLRVQGAQGICCLAQELGLIKAQHTRIGGKFVRGVSGGERKRVAFGQALLGNPALIFADEPTSGATLMQCLTSLFPRPN